METIITSDMPVSVSLHRAQTDTRYATAHKISYTGIFQSKHHVYLPSTRCNSDGTPYSFQVHDGIEILYITDGQGVLHFADEDIVMQRGDICFINPYELHQFTFDRDCCERLCIVFFPRPLLTCAHEAMPNIITQWLSDQIRLQRRISHGDSLQPTLASILQRIIEICQSNRSCCSLELHSALLQLIAELLNHQRYQAASSTNPTLPAMLYKTIQYLDLHLYTEVSCADAARRLGYNNAYFCRTFKKHFGMTFTEYVQSKRISEAQTLLLRHHDMPITELSARLGFNEPSYFSYLFRKKVGISPSEFAKRYRSP